MPYGKSKGVRGVSIIDISLVVALMISWFVIVNVWQSPLANLMFSTSVLIVCVYLISRFTGFLKYIKLVKFGWTIPAILSIAVWSFSWFNPRVTGVFETEVIAENMLGSFFSSTTIANYLNSFLFPVTESLLIIFLFAFLIGVAYKKERGAVERHSARGFLPLIIVAGIGSLIHTGIIIKMAEAGVVSGTSLFFHQFIAFAVMVAFGFFFGAPAIISVHIVKNLMVYGTVNWWIIAFVGFILLDIYALLQRNKKTRLPASEGLL